MNIKEMVGLLLSIVWFRTAQRGRLCSVKGVVIFKNRGSTTLGDEVTFHSHIQPTYISVHKGAELRIGERSFINFGANISVSKRVIIGDNVQIGPYLLLYDSDFHSSSQGATKSGDVIIEDNVWIASRCTILKGVTIGAGSVVCSGAIVTKDVPAGVVVGGVPAKIIKGVQDE